MTTKFRSVLGLFLAAFLFIPGLVHYAQNHESMRVALANSKRTIASLQAENQQVYARKNSQNIYKYCIPSQT